MDAPNSECDRRLSIDYHDKASLRRGGAIALYWLRDGDLTTGGGLSDDGIGEIQVVAVSRNGKGLRHKKVFSDTKHSVLSYTEDKDYEVETQAADDIGHRSTIIIITGLLSAYGSQRGKPGIRQATKEYPQA